MVESDTATPRRIGWDQSSERALQDDRRVDEMLEAPTYRARLAAASVERSTALGAH